MIWHFVRLEVSWSALENRKCNAVYGDIVMHYSNFTTKYLHAESY